MLLLMRGSILLAGPVSLIYSLISLRNILLGTSCHVFYVAWTQVIIVYKLVAHSSITIFLG